MTRPTGPEDPKYGGTGERGALTTGAPAWDGDLTALDDDELRERINGLGSHIGSLHTVWHRGSWKAANATELAQRELPRWVHARVAALSEQDRRTVDGGR